MILRTLLAVPSQRIRAEVRRAADEVAALASGPILTTITDACGFLLALSLAKSALPHLV